MINTIAIKRLSNNIPIDVASINISLDTDAWAWSWSATLLGATAVAGIQPEPDGTPAVLEATINSHIWHLIVEDWQEQRNFGQRKISVRGRGLSGLLSSPYHLPASATNSSVQTIQQAMADQLPLSSGFSLSYRALTPDWILPAGAWSYANQHPINAIAEAAQQVGLVVVPAMAAKSLTIQPRYRILPWDFASATPNLVVPEAAILSVNRRSNVTEQANAIYVYGGDVGGVFASVRRYLSAADKLLPAYSSPLVTHADAARLVGGRMLAKYVQPNISSITMPLGGSFPLAAIGDLMQVTIGASVTRGLVNAVAISAEANDNSTSVRQEITVGENTPNQWSKLMGLLPKDPVLVGQINTVNGDGTIDLLLLGGGVIRVRGSGVLGTWKYVKSGAVFGDSNALNSPVIIDV